ncbi:hypothetical protein SDC9_200260 [bioreactor metagenome]|uniref:Xylose isomerase-like TIM barrel domain-containing protein n=1 Tax=bioreactor metagenome TaxID=1076179 RepID=A0A645IMR5_9ZZZZ
MTKEQYAECIDEARRISMAASADGVSVAFEYHNNSLTSNACDAVELINDIGRDNIRLYWQTEVTFDTEKNMEALKAVLQYLINIHVFNYSQGKQVLLDEADGADSWSKYMSLIKGDGKNHNFLTEFSKDGLTDSFIHDAAVLKGICRGVYGE